MVKLMVQCFLRFRYGIDFKVFEITRKAAQESAGIIRGRFER